MFYRSSVLPKGTRTPHTIGFSIVELMVSIAIVMLVLSIVVTGQQSFNGAVLLRSQAFEIALAIREIQLGAVSAVSDGSGDFRAAQGIYFNITSPGTNQEYKLFRDADGNRFYGPGEDIGFSGLLDRRFEIRKIGFNGDSMSNELAIVFQRPNFDAMFATDDTNAGSPFDGQVVITIGLRGGTGTVCAEDIREIEVRSTGQISVIECP